jgi:glyoxylase-like metal-dependent hydrolase (beta-lactamase superfamily II)
MLTQVADGVLVHVSDFMRSNAVVVRGSTGVLVVDPGVRADELAGIADELREAGDAVVAGFSTHPHWDHLLWHEGLGTPPRYGTARCAAAIEARLSDPDWRAFVSGVLPPEIADEVPLDDRFGRIVGLAAGTTQIPWDGPDIRIIEHQAHATGHAALLIEERRVLMAGDMLSDILIPILNFMAPAPVDDYLAALHLLEESAGDVEILIPGHGSVGDAAEFRARIERDRSYLEALREGRVPDDPRLGTSAPFAAEMTGIHERQAQQLEEAG